MRTYFIIVMFLVSPFYINCSENQNKSFILSNSKIYDSINKYINEVKDNNTTFNKSFYAIIVNNCSSNAEDICVIITKLNNSKWVIKHLFPSNVIEEPQSIFFIYTGLEKLFEYDTIVGEELAEKYNNYINNDILDNGDLNLEFFLLKEYPVWEICYSNDTVKIDTNKSYLFAPPMVNKDLNPVIYKK